MTSEILTQNREIFRNDLGRAILRSGPRMDTPINASIWLDPEAIRQAQVTNIGDLMRKASLEVDKPNVEKPGGDVLLLRDLLEKNIPLVTVRSIAQRLVEKNFESIKNQHTDSLTGLFSREFAIKAMEEFLEIYLTGGNDTSIGFVDIEHLNTHNLASYDFGNGAMQAVAYILQDTGDIAARYFSGDEDLLVMPAVPIDEAGKILEGARTHIPEAVERVKTENLRGKAIGSTPVSFRYGYSSFGQALEYLLQNNEDSLVHMAPEDAVNRIIDVTIGIAQTFERIQKAKANSQPTDRAMKDLVGKYGEETKKLYDFCLSRIGKK